MILYRIREMDNLAQRAIREALEGNWKGAERTNEEILSGSPDDKEA